MSLTGTLTVLIEIFEEAAQLFDASSSELLSLWAIEHASYDRGLDALVEEGHGRRRLDQFCQGRNQFFDESGFLAREDGELVVQEM